MAKETKKLHLACGPNIVDGWDNIDILAKKGIKQHDLRKPLPYKDNTIDAIFHEHFIEHLTKLEAEEFLDECHRVLKIGGSMRIGWPDLKKLLRAYTFKKKKYMNYILPFLASENHRHGKDWDEIFSDCIFGWEHKYAYTANHLKKVLEAHNFKEVTVKNQGVSDFDIALDFRKDPATTYIEAVKK